MRLSGLENWGYFLRTCLAGTLCLLLLACVAKQKPQPEPVAPQLSEEQPEPLSASFEEAAQAFDSGQYRKAAALFEILAAKDASPAETDRALYSLACARLMLAVNPDEYKKAMQALETWEKKAGPTAEDPRMLLRALRFFKPPYHAREAQKEPKPAKIQDPDCAKKLADKEKEVKLLQKQLNALETIHREIQEKKRGMTSP